MNITAVRQLAQVSENGKVTFCFFVSATVTRARKKTPRVHYKNKNNGNGSGQKDARKITIQVQRSEKYISLLQGRD